MKEIRNHTFVICAYKEVPYLGECVESLLNQTIKSEIIISTSTPNDYIRGIAKKYKVKLVINKKKSGHIEDFCFAYSQVKTKYVTLCHQDDIYLPSFGKKVVETMEKFNKPLICFTNYNELKYDKVISNNKVLKVKHLMNYLFRFKFISKSKFFRRLILSLGNSICAPTVTYNKDLIKEPIIASDLKSNIDWDTWLYFANMKGSFVYIKDKLLNHRIHDLSTTSLVLSNKQKQVEDKLIFSRFWPKWMVKILMKVYGSSEVNYQLEDKNKLKKGVNKMGIILVILYLILTVSGLVLYKLGTNKDFLFSFNNGIFQVKLSFISIIGLLCYLFSFLLYLLVLPRFDLTYILPIVSGISYIGIYILSIMVLKETVEVNGIVGSIIILMGIFIMNFGGKR